MTPSMMKSRYQIAADQSLPASDAVVSLLRNLHPPQCVLHVGAGQGLGPSHDWRQWDVPHALLVDPVAAPWLGAALEQHSGWRHSEATISASGQPIDWHNNSNAAESGLFDASALRPIWPHLVTLDMERRLSRTLDALAAEYLPMWPEYPARNWLVMDCLPAADLLQGAAATLAECSVVWVRVVAGDPASAVESAHLDGVQRVLGNLHFTKLAVFEGLNPLIGEAVFVRDWSALAQSLTLLQGESVQAAADVARLQQAQQVAEQAHGDLVADMAQGLQAQTDLRTLTQQLEAANAALGAELAQLAADHVAVKGRLQDCEQIEHQVRLQNAAFQQEIAELRQALEGERKAKGELLAASREWSRTDSEQKTAVTIWQSEAAQLQQRIQELEADSHQKNFRQQLQHDELVRAEAQIGLIKDLLLREQGL